MAEAVAAVLIADLDPALRHGYVATWTAHREAFGYSLFAEIPYLALHLLEDHQDARIPEVNALIVNEFQDLNAAEIALVRALAERGLTIVAVGDDDQSIYGFRMADPVQMRANRPMGQVELLSNLAIGQSFGCNRGDLDLMWR